jgi:sugar phosphate isomerase/epimerase
MKNAVLLCLLIIASNTLNAQKKTGTPEIGVVQNIENDSLLEHFGYRYLVESVGKMVSPRSVTEEQFQANVQKIKSMRMPMYAFNIFIPGELKVVGPEVNETAVLQYVETVFQRCEKVGVHKIIWGSGGSRRVPEGFDPAKAKEQFISIAKKIAALASRYKITLALENLNSTETNFINTVEEALDVVKKVDHKNLRLCVDIYHMLKDSEAPSSIEKTKGYVVYCEVAEKEGRTPPGVKGDDFRPYFTALKKVGYHGEIMIECRWENVASQGAAAFQSLQEQILDVYGGIR